MYLISVWAIPNVPAPEAVKNAIIEGLWVRKIQSYFTDIPTATADMQDAKRGSS